MNRPEPKFNPNGPLPSTEGLPALAFWLVVSVVIAFTAFVVFRVGFS
jgi:hypothetical protein